MMSFQKESKRRIHVLYSTQPIQRSMLFSTTQADLIFWKQMDDGVVYILKYIASNEKRHKTMHNIIEKLDLLLKERAGTERTFFRSINKEDEAYPKVISFERGGQKDDYLYRTLFDAKGNALPDVVVWNKSDEGEEMNASEGVQRESDQPVHSNGKKRAAEQCVDDLKKMKLIDGDPGSVAGEERALEEVERLRTELAKCKADEAEYKVEIEGLKKRIAVNESWNTTIVYQAEPPVQVIYASYFVI